MRTENRNTQFRLALHVSAQMRSILLTYAQNHGEVSYNTSYSCGAPQVGFSATIRKIKARTSLLTRFRPPTWLTLETHVQYKRNPARCQFTTVLGVTKMRGLVHPDQNVLNATQNSLCRAVNRRRGCCACRASNCRRRARFSRTRSPREWKALTNQPRKCRSDTIVARILAEKSECSFSPSHSFCRCTTFWRHNPQISPGFRGSRSIPELHGLPVPGLWIRRLRGMETSAAPAGRPPALGQ